MLDAVGRLVSWAVGLLIAAGWVWVLLPGWLRRLRKDPVPRFQPVPGEDGLGADGRRNVSIVQQELVSRLLAPATDESHGDGEAWIRDAARPGSDRVSLSWDEEGPEAHDGRFYVSLFHGDDVLAFYECDPDGDVREPFWTACQFLKSGVVWRHGRAWLHHPDQGLWQGLDPDGKVELQPVWAEQLPA